MGDSPRIPFDVTRRQTTNLRQLGLTRLEEAWNLHEEQDG
jgi:hypothetical protein